MIVWIGGTRSDRASHRTLPTRQSGEVTNRSGPLGQCIHACKSGAETVGEAPAGWPVRRSCCEDASECAFWIAARVDLQDFAISLVEPGDDANLVAGLYTMQTRRCPRFDLDPRLRRALRPLLRRFTPLLESRANHSDRPQIKTPASFRLHASFLRRKRAAGKRIPRVRLGGQPVHQEERFMRVHETLTKFPLGELTTTQLGTNREQIGNKLPKNTREIGRPTCT